jgi:peptide-methionine (S)-S-oxide reductase
MSYFLRKNIEMPNEANALAGRSEPLNIEPTHFVNGRTIFAPYPAEMKQIVLGLGCFWGAERAFWELDGVYVTSVGYAGGFTNNPTYDEICSGMTAHTEVVHVVYDPDIISLIEVLKVFWEKHDPTQGMRQGNDLGTQYRSAIYYLQESDLAVIKTSYQQYQNALEEAGLGSITTEIAPLKEYFYAETYHQQYLAKNPNGYCGLGGTGVTCGVP